MRALFLVNNDVITHESQESISVIGRRHGRNSRSLHENAIFQQVFKLLVNIVVLEVVNDADMVDIAPTARQELMAISLEALSDHDHLY